jgi:fused signal recognition particle receptor
MARLFDKWQKGLVRTRAGVFDRISRAIGGKKQIDPELLDELEEILIEGDVGVDTTMEIVGQLEQLERETGTSLKDQVKDVMKAVLKEGISCQSGSSGTEMEFKPYVILVVGVNGTGKTTTIGKLASRFEEEGKKVLLAGADTFRAAAGEQLEVWARRTGADVIRQSSGADPASVAFDALQAALARKVDVLIVDTAGRLHTKVNLMEELKKIRRVLNRQMESAPHEVLLVLDATTGQNGLSQAERFARSVGVTGIALTKLDGTAKGGIVVAIHRKLGIPVKWVGVGESVDDLIPFDPEAFVTSLLGGDGEVESTG